MADVHGVNGVAIVASIAASVAAAEADRGAASSSRTTGSQPPASGARVPPMACVCARLRAVCRRRAVSAWLSVEGINARVAAYHPRGHQTTLLHVAAAEGMEAAMDVLLERGAHPLALDSSGRTPLQVARGRASLVAKLTHAHAQAEAERAQAAAAAAAVPVN